MKITFIGLGIMGSRMAANLLKGGADLTVFNRSEAPMKTLHEKGAKTSTSIATAVKEADLVISMLSSPQVVEEVMVQKGLPAMKRDAHWIDCSTVNRTFVKSTSAITRQHQINYLEAPVAGTKPQAESGELVFFVGGEEAHLKNVAPYLQLMGSKTLHFGELGNGAAFKMVVNMMLGMSMAAFSESVKLGKSLGLDEEMLLNTLPNLPISAPFLKMKAELIKEANYEAQFPIELLYKDLHLAMLSAFERGLPLPLTGATKEIYGRAVNSELGREDMGAIFKV